ncbi:MAG: MORN repeat-containing protein [Oscillospiraceae bacterium]
MINKLFSTFRTLGRVLKNLLLRPFRTVYSRVRYFFSAGRLVSAVPGFAKKLPKILKTKPEKREDYFDWGGFYIAKSLVLLLAVIIVAVPLLYIFLLHPLLTSWFWVKDFVVDDSELSSYSGRVCVYYDQERENLKFSGRLKDGKAVESGEEYYENGRNKYIGAYVDGQYEGEGILYYEDGVVMYRGEFAGGRYNGVGEYTNENGDLYSGTFENGKLSGRGTITQNGVLYYDGEFADGVISGEGRILYADGTVRFSGSFSNGALNGTALEYYSSGNVKYNGSFTGGLYNGNGVLYSENGKKLYSGGFDMGKYSGNGTLFDDDGTKLYTGEFEDGVFSGSGTLYGEDGSVTTGSFAGGEIVGAAVRTFASGRKYEGCYSDNLMNGSGTISDAAGTFNYTGTFLDDDIDYSVLLGAEPGKVKEMIPSLEQTVDSDCFYLTDGSFGIAMKCSFADGDAPAQAVEIFTRPISGEVRKILSVKDINAPSAQSVGKLEDAVLPAWAAERFGVDRYSVECYAAYYEETTVYYWTDSSTGTLLLKSAEAANGTPPGGSVSGSDEAGSGLTYDEIISIFEELGLDINDFSSLGFAAE